MDASGETDLAIWLPCHRMPCVPCHLLPWGSIGQREEREAKEKARKIMYGHTIQSTGIQHSKRTGSLDKHRQDAQSISSAREGRHSDWVLPASQERCGRAAPSPQDRARQTEAEYGNKYRKKYKKVNSPLIEKVLVNCSVP